jgi:hypothetical protein
MNAAANSKSAPRNVEEWNAGRPLTAKGEEAISKLSRFDRAAKTARVSTDARRVCDWVGSPEFSRPLAAVTAALLHTTACPAPVHHSSARADPSHKKEEDNRTNETKTDPLTLGGTSTRSRMARLTLSRMSFGTRTWRS